MIQPKRRDTIYLLAYVFLLLFTIATFSYHAGYNSCLNDIKIELKIGDQVIDLNKVEELNIEKNQTKK